MHFISGAADLGWTPVFVNSPGCSTALHTGRQAEGAVATQGLLSSQWRLRLRRQSRTMQCRHGSHHCCPHFIGKGSFTRERSQGVGWHVPSAHSRVSTAKSPGLEHGWKPYYKEERRILNDNPVHHRDGFLLKHVVEFILGLVLRTLFTTSFSVSTTGEISL